VGARRLLVVDGDSITCDALRRLLTPRGWHVDVAPTLRQAVHALDQNVYAWIVLDLALPDGEGIALLELVRQRGLANGVVLVTGVVDQARLDHATALEPNALLHKPVDFDQLLAILDA
jgi:DNA-binding response OmpR family regulator